MGQKKNWFNVVVQITDYLKFSLFTCLFGTAGLTLSFCSPRKVYACNAVISLLPPAHSTASLRDLPLSRGSNSHHSANFCNVFAWWPLPRPAPHTPLGLPDVCTWSSASTLNSWNLHPNSSSALWPNLPCSQSMFSHHHSNDPSPGWLLS